MSISIKSITKYSFLVLSLVFLIGLVSGCVKNQTTGNINNLNSDENHNVNTSDEGVITIEEFEELRKISVEDVDITEFPKALGKIEYGNEMRPLIHKYYCSDLCPQNGRLYVLFQGIDSAEACQEIAGNTVKDIAWGGYIGCEPMFFYPN